MRGPVSAPTRLEQDDLAARLEDARELVERGFRIGHGGDDILRDHHVEGIVREIQPLGVHHLERLDMVHAGSVTRSRAFSSIAPEMSTPTIRLPCVVRQRDAGADADFEDAAADALRGDDRGAPATLEHRPEHES